MQLLNDLKSRLDRTFRRRTSRALGRYDELRTGAESISRAPGGLGAVENIDDGRGVGAGRCLQIMSWGHCMTFLEQR